MDSSLERSQEPIFSGSGETYLPKTVWLGSLFKAVLEPRMKSPVAWPFGDRLLGYLLPNFIADIRSYHRFPRTDITGYFSPPELAVLDRDLAVVLSRRVADLLEPSEPISEQKTSDIPSMIDTLTEVGVLTRMADDVDCGSGWKGEESLHRLIQITVEHNEPRVRVGPVPNPMDTVLQRLRLYRLISFVAKRQQDFLSGRSDYVEPLTLREAAESLGMLESTASRLLKNVRLLTGQDTIEPDILLSRLEHSRQIAILRQVISHENREKPLTDGELADILARDHEIPCARRTIAKYRSLAAIPPAWKRRPQKAKERG